MIKSDQLTLEERILHEKWMQEALLEAQKAAQLEEVPIGAVVVKDNQIIGRGHNIRELARLATGHAEIQAIQAANQTIEAWRLEGASLYVTLEPCPMCAGAIIMARLDKVIYAASDPKGGCAGSLMNLLAEDRFNHQPQVIQGVLAQESSQMMRNFFKDLRQRNKARRRKEAEISTRPCE